MNDQKLIIGTFSVPRKRIVHIISSPDDRYIDDGQGHHLWWFGSDPPNGTLSPASFKDLLEKNDLRQIPPPWAAIFRDERNAKTWIATDPIGLQHIFIRNSDQATMIGPDAIALASYKPPVHLDPIGAYELMCRGNPQGGRTLFSEVACVAPATLIEIDSEIKSKCYWSPPDPSPIDKSLAVEVFSKAIKEAAVRHWQQDDVQELTAGRDSMLLLATLLSEGIPVRTWTHGFNDSPDLIGARDRASRLHVPHQAISLEPLKTINPEESLLLAREYLRASSGLANILECWHLPWVLKQLNGNTSITGVGGEVFRGFYYEWTGKGIMPRALGQWFLLHGKLRDAMPFTNSIVKKEISAAGNSIIKKDFEYALRPDPFFWHSLDVYYLMHRMHHFAGTTFSATRHWRKVRMPLFDPNVIDCLHLIPIELRRWGSGLSREVTKQLIRNEYLEKTTNYSYEKLSLRANRLRKRLQQLRGTFFRPWLGEAARNIMNLQEITALFNPDDMVTGGLYNPKALKNFIQKIQSGNYVPLILGAILTIELAARETGASFHGVSKTN